MSRLPVTAPTAPDIASMVSGSRFVATVIANARALDERSLRQRTLDAYRDLARQIDSTGGGAIVRMWNFIPDILSPTTGGRDRYMAFNEGRYDAMCEWFGGRSGLLDRAPAASGVGTSSDDLEIHALVAPEPGLAIQNPRQSPAVWYSKRFGPRPPCFARATRCGPTLLVSGTAAIAGEDSVVGSLELQLDVTLANLRALLRSSLGHEDLKSFRHVRAYYPSASDADEIERRMTDAFGAVAIEWVQVDLCRRELLVEIEGVASESRT
jgi:enamine deaminase RidA (YjgF/YER057c/UK114 family)